MSIQRSGARVWEVGVGGIFCEPEIQIYITPGSNLVLERGGENTRIPFCNLFGADTRTVA